MQLITRMVNCLRTVLFLSVWFLGLSICLAGSLICVVAGLIMALGLLGLPTVNLKLGQASIVSGPSHGR